MKNKLNRKARARKQAAEDELVRELARKLTGELTYEDLEESYQNATEQLGVEPKTLYVGEDTYKQIEDMTRGSIYFSYAFNELWFRNTLVIQIQYQPEGELHWQNTPRFGSQRYSVVDASYVSS